MKVTVYLVKSFTQDSNAGNPAGVILNSTSLSEQQMIGITSQYGFSECVFVQESQKADFRMRFFTSLQEVDYCSHATIAAFHVISQLSKYQSNIKQLTQETKKGVFAVDCHDSGYIEMEQMKPQTISFDIDKEELAQLLNIKKENIVGAPAIISTGTPKLIIPLASLKTLFEIKPDFEGIKKYSLLSNSRGFYPFTLQTIDPASDCHARQFNPLVGINEDPITGVAAGALGVYLVNKQILNKRSFIIEQGYSMNQGGKIHVKIGEEVKVGGHATIFGKDELILSA